MGPLSPSKSHNRAKARGTTGSEHLIMSASAVCVTQTAGHCCRGASERRCHPCTLTPPHSPPETIDALREFVPKHIKPGRTLNEKPALHAFFLSFLHFILNYHQAFLFKPLATFSNSSIPHLLISSKFCLFIYGKISIMDFISFSFFQCNYHFVNFHSPKAAADYIRISLFSS